MMGRSNYQKPIVLFIELKKNNIICNSNIDVGWGIGINGDQQEGWWGSNE